MPLCAFKGESPSTFPLSAPFLRSVPTLEGPLFFAPGIPRNPPPLVKQMKNILSACAASFLLFGCATTSTTGPGQSGSGDSPQQQDAQSTPPKSETKPETAVQVKKGGEESTDIGRQHEVASELRRIEARVRRGESGAMRQEYTERIAKRPDDLFAKFYLAWIDAPSEDAGTQINSLAKLNPEEPWLRTALARIYMTWKGFLSLAQSEADQVLARHPDFIPALAVRAELLRRSGKTDEAIALFREILTKDPECFEAQLWLASALEDAGDLAGAQEALGAAVAIDGSDVSLLGKLAAILIASGDKEAVLPIYEKLTQAWPEDASMRKKLGDLRLELGDKEGAAADLEEVLRMTGAPSLEIAKTLTGIYAELEKTQDEQRALESLVRFDEGATAANFMRLWELRKADGDPEGAENALRQAIAASPDDLKLKVLLAESLRERDALVEAITAHREAVRLGASGLKNHLRDLEKRAGLPPTPPSGNVNRVYNVVQLRLKNALTERQKTQPWLGGTIGARITIGQNGRVSAVELTRNSLQDQALTALVYFSLLDAELPGERPRNVSFEFVLLPKDKAER